METLRDRFVSRLFDQAPTALLDIGAGDGTLVRLARDRGVFAVGLEVDAPKVAGEDPPPAWVVASADALPFGSASIEWVSLRHVPHHLPNLGQALREAWRVAARGLVIAEPWFDESRADQRFGLRADRWLKRQDRRSGRFHADVISADELLAHLPGSPQGRVETYRPERLWSAEDLEREAREATDGLPPDPDDERELATLCEVAGRGRMTENGTLILIVEKG